jgi:hypothetical protein
MPDGNTWTVNSKERRAAGKQQRYPLNHHLSIQVYVNNPTIPLGRCDQHRLEDRRAAFPFGALFVLKFGSRSGKELGINGWSLSSRRMALFRFCCCKSSRHAWISRSKTLMPQSRTARYHISVEIWGDVGDSWCAPLKEQFTFFHPISKLDRSRRIFDICMIVLSSHSFCIFSVF